MSTALSPLLAPMLSSGHLKPIAVTSKERVAGYESIPPIADTIPGFDFYGWLGVSAPSGAPRDILERLNTAINARLEDPDFQNSLAKVGFYAFPRQTIEEAEAAVRDEMSLWRKIVADLGITPA